MGTLVQEGLKRYGLCHTDNLPDLRQMHGNCQAWRPYDFLCGCNAIEMPTQINQVFGYSGSHWKLESDQVDGICAEIWTTGGAATPCTNVTCETERIHCDNTFTSTNSNLWKRWSFWFCLVRSEDLLQIWSSARDCNVSGTIQRKPCSVDSVLSEWSLQWSMSQGNTWKQLNYVAFISKNMVADHVYFEDHVYCRSCLLYCRC